MKIAILLCGAIAATVPAVAVAQTPNEDVRCVLLSESFVQAAKDENTRRASAMTGAFYLGRVNARMSQAAVAAAIRAQGKGLPIKEAQTTMQACAARAQAAQAQLGVAAKQAQGGH